MLSKKTIKKDQLLYREPINYISEKKNVVSINCSSQTIDIKWGEQDWISYYLEDISFKVIEYKYNQWKAKRGVIYNFGELSDFLRGIATTQNAIDYYKKSKYSPRPAHELQAPNNEFMTFKYWDIKTVEEWYLLGKITEEEKRMILEWESNWRIERENAGSPTIEEVDNPDYSPPLSPPRTFSICSKKTISNEKYYLLEQIKEGLREWTEAQIEVAPQ